MNSTKHKQKAGSSRSDRGKKPRSAKDIQKLIPADWLTAEQKKVFKMLEKLFKDSGVSYYTIDSNILNMYALWMSIFHFFAQQIADKMAKGDKDLLVVHYENSTQVDVHYTILSKCSDEIIKLSKLIGITPYARGKIQEYLDAGLKQEDPEDEF